MAYDPTLREESLKLKVAADWFAKFDCTDIIGRIDFAVKLPNKKGTSLFGDEYLLWGEAKQQPTDIIRMLAQLLITIKQDASNQIPPRFVGCFDCEKIAFVEYTHILPVFNVNDFDWTQTPSAVNDKTVETVAKTIDTNKIYTFYFDHDPKEIIEFIKNNFVLNNSNVLSTQIDRNNFIFIYQKWRQMVMPYIEADWAFLKKNYSLYDRDFFLAELNIDDNGTTDLTDDKSINNNFYITFEANASKPYSLSRKDAMGLDMEYHFGFKKGGLDHYADFWKRYKRPPQETIWKHITERLDLLVPQDVRERKGAFFTPQIWVEKSQQYIADVLGENWQEEYYVWDCCAGTGNLLNGLTNKYNIWASTLDQQDVDVMCERVDNGANLLKNHIFQFDFLNDEFTKLPEELQNIINDPEKRKKLVLYINPPYAEAGNAKKITGTGEHKNDVAISQTTYKRYLSQIGIAGRELFAQFFIRIYEEIPGCVLAEFSKLKILQASNFNGFRNVFRAHLEKMFIVPSWTFDNVKGLFPIGFFVWNLSKQECFNEIISDVIDDNSEKIGTKKIFNTNGLRTITDWIIEHRKKSDFIGYMTVRGCDFQQSKYNYIINDISNVTNPRGSFVALGNLCQIGIYSFVVHCFPNTWLNDRDQFLYPNDGWKTDKEFQADCLCWTLFNNNIQSKYGINHWIPFTESEINAQEKFESHFMVDFMSGKLTNSGKTENQTELFAPETESFVPTEPMQFSAEANAVFDAGRELWIYYHAQPNVNVNASLYDIKEYFQGRNDKGKMNNSSTDEHYNELIGSLRSALKILAKKIEPKVYEYGFLK